MGRRRHRVRRQETGRGGRPAEELGAGPCGRAALRFAAGEHSQYTCGVILAIDGGPILRDEDAAAYAARYQGRVAGDTMIITVLHGTTKIGPFRIKRGARPILRKCR